MAQPAAYATETSAPMAVNPLACMMRFDPRQQPSSNTLQALKSSTPLRLQSDETTTRGSQHRFAAPATNAPTRQSGGWGPQSKRGLGRRPRWLRLAGNPGEGSDLDASQAILAGKAGASHSRIPTQHEEPHACSTPACSSRPKHEFANARANGAPAHPEFPRQRHRSAGVPHRGIRVCIAIQQPLHWTRR